MFQIQQRKISCIRQANSRGFLVGLLSAAAIISQWSVASAENWSQFRGPDANAKSPTPLPLNWADENGQTTNIRWKVSTEGEGWSQPIVWENKVYMTAAVPVSTNTDSGPEPYAGGGGRRRSDLTDIEYKYDVVCLDADSGLQIWRTACKQGPPPIPGTAPIPTPPKHQQPMANAYTLISE